MCSGRSLSNRTGGRPISVSLAYLIFDSDRNTGSNSMLGFPKTQHGHVQVYQTKIASLCVDSSIIKTSKWVFRVFTQFDKDSHNGEAVLVLERLLSTPVVAVPMHDVQLGGKCASVQSVLRTPAVARSPMEM